MHIPLFFAPGRHGGRDTWQDSGGVYGWFFGGGGPVCVMVKEGHVDIFSACVSSLDAVTVPTAVARGGGCGRGAANRYNGVL